MQLFSVPDLSCWCRYEGFIYPATINPARHHTDRMEGSVGGVAVGVVCGVLGAGAVVIGAAYYIIMKYNSRRYRGYESL